MKNRSFVLFYVTFSFFFRASFGSGFGKCPKHEYMKNFDVTKFTGQWYEIERSFYLMELISSCTTIDLNINTRQHMNVTVKTFGRLSGKRKISVGLAVRSRKDPSTFIYKVNSILPNTLVPGTGYYQILDTDYNNYAILWKCIGLGLLYTDHIWILGRKRDFDVKLRSQIYNILNQRNIDSERLIIPKNSNCTDKFFR